jgi:hypothetical protein
VISSEYTINEYIYNVPRQKLKDTPRVLTCSGYGGEERHIQGFGGET